MCSSQYTKEFDLIITLATTIMTEEQKERFISALEFTLEKKILKQYEQQMVNE